MLLNYSRHIVKCRIIFPALQILLLATMVAKYHFCQKICYDFYTKFSWEILNACACNSKSYYYEHDSNYLSTE